MLVFEMLVGGLLVAVVLFDAFETIIVPRRTSNRFRLAPHLLLILWPMWRRMGLRLTPAWRREDFLATFAPAMIMAILLMWVLALIAGLGLLLHAMGDQLKPPITDHETAFYLAGTSLVTLGFGDIVATGGPARALLLFAAASGLTILAIVISLTFNLFGSFARREVLVLLLDSRAGVPPSGVTMLETFGRRQTIDALAATFAQYEVWTADLLDSHLAYPLLPYFRSSHDGQSWVSAIGAVLDAATLLMTLIEDDAAQADKALRDSRAGAEMMYSIGCHALVDLSQVYFTRTEFAPGTDVGIEPSEFEKACHTLAAAGYPAKCSEPAWQSFVERRSVYAPRLNRLAQYFACPPAQWIGDRTVLARRHTAHLH